MITGNAVIIRNEVTKRHPAEHRQPHHLHARRPQVEDRDEEVEPRRERRDAQDLQAEQPEVDVGPGRELPLGQVGVAEPAAVGRRMVRQRASSRS